jgi:uncharacterized protein YdaU (DUF1376 family)
VNFYPHHIGDYLTATAHLTWHEDCAYRRLLDVYYSREQALPTEIAQACRLVRAASKDERKAVETVLTEFFTLTDSGWSHSRCEEEIEKAKVAAARSKANGMKGGRPSKKKPSPNPEETQQVISGLSKQTQSEPDPKAPITNPITSYSVPNGTGGKPPMSPDEIVFGYGVPLLVNAGSTDKAARSFLGGLRKGHGDDALINALRNCLREKPLQPLEWLAAALPPVGATTPKPNAQEALEAANRAVADRFLAKEAAHAAH